MITIIEMLTLMPQAFAKNMIINGHQDRYRIHIDGGTERDCDTADLVRNAEFFLDTALADWDRRGTGTCSECIQAAGMIALKNLTGLVFPMSFTAPP